MPPHSIIVGVCLGTLEACECLLCIWDKFPASGMSILPRRSWWRINLFLRAGREGTTSSLSDGSRALPSSPKGPTLLKAAILYFLLREFNMRHIVMAGTLPHNKTHTTNTHARNEMKTREALTGFCIFLQSRLAYKQRVLEKVRLITK
jgi:hypothetical protein